MWVRSFESGCGLLKVGVVHQLFVLEEGWRIRQSGSGHHVGVVIWKWAWPIKSGRGLPMHWNVRGRKWRIRRSGSGQGVGVVFRKWVWPIKSGCGSLMQFKEMEDKTKWVRPRCERGCGLLKVGVVYQSIKCTWQKFILRVLKWVWKSTFVREWCH